MSEIIFHNSFRQLKYMSRRTEARKENEDAKRWEENVSEIQRDLHYMN